MKKEVYFTFESKTETPNHYVKIKEFETFEFYIDELTAPSRISFYSRRELDYLRIELSKVLKKMKESLNKPQEDDLHQPKLF